MIISLEGKESNTEINFFKHLLKMLENKFKNIIFIAPIAIDGNSHYKTHFIKEINPRIVSAIKTKTKKNINHNQNINIFCIWDSLEKNNNLQTNFEEIQKIKQNMIFHSFVWTKCIEMGLFAYLFLKKPNNFYELTKMMEYKNKKSFKSRTNNRLFYDIMQKANLDTNSNTFIEDLIKRLNNNKEKNLIKLLEIIQELNKKTT